MSAGDISLQAGLDTMMIISSFISDQQCTSIYVAGDWNADISDNASCFHKHMVRFRNDNSLVISS